MAGYAPLNAAYIKVLMMRVSFYVKVPSMIVHIDVCLSQWNCSNPDTLGAEESVLISEVS